MHLVQILLPLYDNQGKAFDGKLFGEVKQQLLQRFGGVTAFTRAPAQGLWDDGGSVQRDDVLLVEVMVDSLDRSWWAGYRQELAAKFAQEELLVRAVAIERL